MTHMLGAFILDIFLNDFFAIYFLLKNNFFFVESIQPSVFSTAKILPHDWGDLGVLCNICLLDLFWGLFYDDVFVLDYQITR